MDIDEHMMDIDEPLPKGEADLLALLLNLPYQKRIGYALRLVNNHRNDPALLSLIQELLSTTLLPDRVPFPGKEEDDGYITLLCPQSTASKRFFQRELGLAMASALGEPSIPFLLDAIIHPSTAGKSRAITACASGATNGQLVEVYRKSVPATRESLRVAMVAADRVEALKVLQVWKEPPPVKVIDPRCEVLQRDLKLANPRERDAIWSSAGLSLFRAHRHLHDPLFVRQGSDLVTSLFDLLELYPPPHQTRISNYVQDVPSIPSSLDGRMYSFLTCDLSRTLRLIRRTCYIPDLEHKQRDILKLPSSFMHQRASSRFWHMLPLEGQQNHLLPFILELLQANDQALLKNGQLRTANLLQHAKWQIITAVTNSALAALENVRATQVFSSDRKGIVAFVVYGIGTLASRLYHIAHRKETLRSKLEIELELGNLLRHSVGRILAACRVSAMSDEAFVKDFTQDFTLPLLGGPLKQYPPLVEVVFDSMKGVFDVAQVSKSELQSTAIQFLRALKRKKPSVFDIPDDEVVQPYCSIADTDNDAVFRLLLLLAHPRDNTSIYASSVLDVLSERQKEVIWTYFDDPEYISGQPLDDGGLKNFDLVKVLSGLVSPRARLPVVKALLDHPNMDNSTASALYPLLDISDAPSREVLHKNTYKRLFVERHAAYGHIITATLEQRSPKEFVTTMRFLIPRIKNEISTDAASIPTLFYDVHAILRLFEQATEDEARELGELYLTWEKQNNEAVSRVFSISNHILHVANSALTRFAGSPAHPAFQFGMDLLWAREVYQEGPLKAHKTYSIHVFTKESQLNEDEELKRRQFKLVSKNALGETGFWRILDEQQFVDTLLKQYHKIHRTVPFENSEAYPGFISCMLKLLGVRWINVSALREYTERQLGVLRGIAGSNKRPADWVKKAEQKIAEYILHLRTLYHDAKLTSETLPWWSEFRHLRLYSTDASKEVNLLYKETFVDGKQDQERLDKLVEKLLDIDDSAVYLPFVRSHLMDNRQDLLKDSHIASASVGVFNQLTDDSTPQPPPWVFSSPRRFYPHQCELFAVKLLETIHSGSVSLQSQVYAAEQLTRLPTTTIIELAKLLKEDLNQRIIEAILMFLPRLDEPASGIQFLLAPTYLDSDLARTVIFSVRNSLEHVPAGTLPKILLPVFPPENSKKLLKITVMKELVRLVCQHISHEEHQAFFLTLWKRKLHQDVRIAFIQSAIPFFGSKQENLAWTILRDAVSNHTLALDDALFALLAVHPSPTAENVTVQASDVQTVYVRCPEMLADMAQLPIPSNCHDLYTEDVLYPLSQLSFAIPETFPSLAEKEIKLVRERVRQLQISAYDVIFSRFLNASNAPVFAQRGLDAAKSIALIDAQGVDLFPFFVFGIGKCVALNPQCWQVLCQLVAFLGNAVGSPGAEPTQTSLKAIRRLRGMKLSSNMTFQSPESVRKQLTVDRMALLEPLTKCDHFSITFWERRFHLFSCERRRASSESHNRLLSSELNEARNLLLDLTQLSGALHHDLGQLQSKTISLIETASAPVADTLVNDLLSGSHGLDGIWINELRLQVLSRRARKTLDYARALAAFNTQISTYHQTFYARHWEEINQLVLSTLTSNSAEKKVPKDLVATLLDPIYERAESSAWDLQCLDHLLDKIPDIIIRHRPQWAIERVTKKLSALQPWEVSSRALRPAVLLVEFVNTTCVPGSFTGHKSVGRSDFSPLTALFVEAIYSGNLRNFDLERLIRSAWEPEPGLFYPYFVTDRDDGSGGDIENRRSKATVSQLLDRFQEWKSTYASQYLTGVHPPQTLPSVLSILQEIVEAFPKLVLVHPSLFFSYAAVTFGQSELDTTAKISNVLGHLKFVLKPDRQSESGTRWGWAPPLSLTLSFVRILFTETANEVAETVLDDHADVGSQTCKLAALKLLEWWTQKLYGAKGSDLGQLVKTMEKGEGREDLMRQYEELKLLACGDECRAVREKAFVLPSVDSLKL